ncbi:MAG TPA: 2OG-Fe(II) oxygenase family protein, partial [Aquella sp.]|nr:2OG-Fe(II) oxygenase family protein [Aquella sp.]
TDLPVFRNTLLMMVGDVIDFMTNSYLKSFLHRVINNGARRFSAPFFMNLDFDTKIKVLPKFKTFREASRSQHLPDQIIIGHHLIGQLYRDFPYLKARIDQGAWQMPFNIPTHNLFEQKYQFG